jgi:hypothetical protein
MTTVYLISPGTRVAVSYNGSDYKLQSSPQLQSSEPPEVGESHAVFVRGEKRFRVLRADVVVSHQQGQRGYNLFGT